MYKHSGVSLLMGARGHGIQGPHFVEMALSPLVTMMVLVVSASHILCASKLNSSVLLLSSRRKLLQLWGVLVIPVTLRLIPRPPSGSLSGRVSPDSGNFSQL